MRAFTRPPIRLDFQYSEEFKLELNGTFLWPIDMPMNGRSSNRRSPSELRISQRSLTDGLAGAPDHRLSSGNLQAVFT
jgi:hypothetical protein